MLRAEYRTHRFPPHEHAEYAIGFIEAGAQAYTLERRHRVLMPAGSICLINSGQLHEGAPGMEAGWRYRMIYISANDLHAATADSIDANAQPPIYFTESVVSDPWLLAQLQQAHLASESSNLTDLEKSARLTAALKALTHRHARYHNGVAPTAILPGAVKRAREYIDAHFSQNPSLPEIAAVAGLSPFHLLRAFRHFTGMAPHAYLIQRRVEHARHLLLKGLSLRVIAATVGYSDQAHLSREFRRFYGVPPSRIL
ncbi:AraC family transcriptional regulator [Cupriavidus lacunae]|uniref:AraC family transcriptional regulator n=2 Tax=Cupriavidus lacunae TaxID=2666307 RepID=A0A370P284_9BURK|nr:AraC family transcriptional regulator [Cupriavidus lacunae]